MYAIDFEYDNQYLSDYGFIICNFDSSSGIDIVAAGSKITFNKVSRNKGRQYSLVSTQYDGCVQTTFDICKNPDLFDYEDMVISNDEYRSLMRWLNRHEFLRFNVFDESNDGRDACYYDASFNIDKINIGDILYGLRLTMETDKPFGYGQEQIVSLDFTNIYNSHVLRNISDEIGSICPYTTIICNADGDLQIYNELEDCTTLIKNCKVGEVITLDGSAHIISTTYASHDICDDFNYEFLRIGNTIDQRDNCISVSMPCYIEIKYSPIIKVTP